jgi:hypothetical protein
MIVVSSSDYTASSGKAVVNNEFENIWKGAIIVYLRDYPGI